MYENGQTLLGPPSPPTAEWTPGDNRDTGDKPMEKYEFGRSAQPSLSSDESVDFQARRSWMYFVYDIVYMYAYIYMYTGRSEKN